MDGGPSFGFSAGAVGGAPTQPSTNSSSKWAQQRMGKGTIRRHRHHCTTRLGKPAQRRHHSRRRGISAVLNTEQNIDLSVAVCSQVSIPASGVLLLSCRFWFVALPLACPLSLPRFDHRGGYLALADRHWTLQSEDTTVWQHDPAASLPPDPALRLLRNGIDEPRLSILIPVHHRKIRRSAPPTTRLPFPVPRFLRTMPLAPA